MDVMVVEDDRLQRSRLARICEQNLAGGSVISCNSAADALRRLETDNVDLVFIAVGLPDMSGITLARRITDAYPRMLLAFVTADKGNAYDAFRLGAMDYVLKPYQDHQVIEVLEKADRTLHPADECPSR